MNFFEHQDRAHRNTQFLVVLFVITLLCIIATVYLAAIFTFGLVSHGQGLLSLWQPGFFLTVAIPTVAVIGCGSSFKLMQLKQGGKVIATDLGGRRINSATADPAERQLLNVVEEMAIASGISVPAVYVLDHETGINAFAAGFSTNDAVIGVTRGALNQLDRDELQGVIGHEFSHILNGDMRLNLRLVGLLHGLLLIYLIGRVLFRWNSVGSRNEKANGTLFFGLALIVIGGIGMLGGRLIKSAVSRQREFLADASAVQFTRNSAGLAGALRKIAGHTALSLVSSPHAEANSHLFFSSALRFSLLGELFATHPPLAQRIHRLDANGARWVAAASARPALRSPTGATAGVMGFASGTAASMTVQAKPDDVITQVGTVDPAHFAYAQALLAQLPESLQLGVRDRDGAIAIVYSLAFDPERLQGHEQQIQWLQSVETAEVVDHTLQCKQTVVQLDPRMRLPLLDLTVPALRQGTTEQNQRLMKCVNGLVKADQHVSLCDFMLVTVLWHRLLPSLKPASKPPMQHTSIEPIWVPCLNVLAALARVGQTEPDSINYAFRSGVYRLPGAGLHERPEQPPLCNFTELHKSLNQVAATSPKLKQAVVDACAHTVLLDNQVTVQEADLLRAIAIVLDCPLPPFIQFGDRASTSTTADQSRRGQLA